MTYSSGRSIGGVFTSRHVSSIHGETNIIFW